MQIDSTIYGYPCVLTDAQDLTSQVAQLKATGCTTIFCEKLSGKTCRPAPAQAPGESSSPQRCGDYLAVDRLSRDTTDLLVIAHDIRQVGVSVRWLAEPVLDTTGYFVELIFGLLNLCIVGPLSR